MIRRELIGMVAAFVLATFSGIKAGTESPIPTAAAKPGCACCGAACACPACVCDAQSLTSASCPCCGGTTCCSAKRANS